MINIHLDKDEQTSYQVKDVTEIQSFPDMIELCGKKLKVNGDYSNWGLKTKCHGFLIHCIGDIDKTRVDLEQELYIQDQDYYDNKLDVDSLVYVNLDKEASRMVRDLGKCLDELAKTESKTRGHHHPGPENEALPLAWCCSSSGFGATSKPAC